MLLMKGTIDEVEAVVSVTVGIAVKLGQNQRPQGEKLKAVFDFWRNSGRN